MSFIGDIYLLFCFFFISIPLKPSRDCPETAFALSLNLSRVASDRLSNRHGVWPLIMPYGRNTYLPGNLVRKFAIFFFTQVYFWHTFTLTFTNFYYSIFYWGNYPPVTYFRGPSRWWDCTHIQPNECHIDQWNKKKIHQNITKNSDFMVDNSIFP